MEAIKTRSVGTNGLISVASPDEIKEMERPPERKETVMETQLAAHIRKAWERNRRAKNQIEDVMLQCRRQRNGEYDPEVLADIKATGGSEIYMMLTSTKCRSAESWIHDTQNVPGQRSWGIAPTPEPDLSPEDQEVILTKMRMDIEAAIQQGLPFDQHMMAGYQKQLESRLKEFLKEEAKMKAENMALRMEDQMAEGGWDRAFRDFISDVVTYPTGFIRGPIIRNRKTLKWGNVGEQWTPVVGNELRAEWERVSPFDVYPSPEAQNINDGDLLERYPMRRADLLSLKGVKGFDADNIDRVLREYGDAEKREWLGIDQERAEAEGRPYENEGGTELIDSLLYWGSVSGKKLLDWDKRMNVEPLEEYHVSAWLIGHIVIGVMINDHPLGHRPYSYASFEQVPGSLWGRGVPQLCRDYQRMCNAAARSLSNNMGISSGPQVEVNEKRLMPGEEITTLTPWRIWQTQSDPSGSGHPAIRFFQPESNAKELMDIFEKFEAKADDATGIPKYIYGNSAVSGAGRTASGLSMLMNNAAKGIKQVISHIDRAKEDQLSKLYVYNMLYDPDPNIKGDAKFIARGSSELLHKEAMQAVRNEWLQSTANPFDIQLIGPEARLDVLRESAKTMDLPIEKFGIQPQGAENVQNEAPPGEQV